MISSLVSPLQRRSGRIVIGFAFAAWALRADGQPPVAADSAPPGAVSPGTVSGDAWSESPYRVMLCCLGDRVPEVRGRATADASASLDMLAESIASELQRRFQRVVMVQARAAPAPCLDWLASNDEPPAIERILESTPDLKGMDKLWLVMIRETAGGFQIQGWERDLMGPRWRALGNAAESQPTRMPRAAADLFTARFAPLGMIGRTKGESVDVRIRGGLLADEVEGLTLPAANELFEVALFRGDAAATKTGPRVEPVPWTVLRVREIRRGKAICDLVSGLRTPFRSQTSGRVIRYALATRPVVDHTVLRLTSNPPANKPLVAYGVSLKDPDAKRSVPVGQTDWRAEIRLVAGDSPLKWVYVHNGNQLLVRLPLVIGAVPLVEARLPDDDPRLAAEGMIRGMQERIVDIRVRQKVLEMRIRDAAKRKDVVEAEKLLGELRDLESKDDFVRMLNDRQRDFVSEDRGVSTRIEQLFLNTRKVLQQQPANNELLIELRNLIAAAKSGAVSP